MLSNLKNPAFVIAVVLICLGVLAALSRMPSIAVKVTGGNKL